MTSGTTFSEHWYRVAGLHPRLQPQVRVERHAYRGQVWHVLEDGSTGRQHRLNPLAWAMVARLDGRHSVQEVWDTLVAEHGSQAPTQPEVLALLGQLHNAELVTSEAAPDLGGLFEQRRRRRQRDSRARRQPLAWRVSLFDPTRMLDALALVGRVLFRPAAFWACLALLLFVLAMLVPRLGEWRAYFATHATTPQMLLLMWLVFPPVKALHELAHGLAVRRWGGVVPEMGVTLMLLMPVPYVDASAASTFRDKRRRVVVSLAGIGAELVLAALAAWLWLVVADGWVRQAAFAVMLIGGVSTLFFNGNPLLRMDAYHALADAIESPGLAPRSRAWWFWLARRSLFGVRQARPPAIGPGETRWLAGYGAASWLYRVFVAVLVVGWLGTVHLLLGVAIALWFVFSMVLKPLAALWKYLSRSPELGPRRPRAQAVSGGAAVLVLALLFAWPMPAAVRADGVVWLPDEALVRAGADGFVAEVLADDGARVVPGQPVLRLADPTLPVEIEKLQARLRGIDAALHLALFTGSRDAGSLLQDRTRTEAELERAQERLDALTVRAAAAGRLALARAEDLPGSFVARGTVLAHTLPDSGTSVRVVLAQDDARALTRAGRVEVRLADEPARNWVAWAQVATPAATRELPSPLFGDRAGGPFATDPGDSRGLRTREAVFTLDLQLPREAPLLVGSRAWVRFGQGAEPLALQGLRRLRQLFIGRLAG